MLFENARARRLRGRLAWRVLVTGDVFGFALYALKTAGIAFCGMASDWNDDGMDWDMTVRR